MTGVAEVLAVLKTDVARSRIEIAEEVSTSAGIVSAHLNNLQKIGKCTRTPKGWVKTGPTPAIQSAARDLYGTSIANVDMNPALHRAGRNTSRGDTEATPDKAETSTALTIDAAESKPAVPRFVDAKVEERAPDATRRSRYWDAVVELRAERDRLDAAIAALEALG